MALGTNKSSVETVTGSLVQRCTRMSLREMRRLCQYTATNPCRSLYARFDLEASTSRSRPGSRFPQREDVFAGRTVDFGSIPLRQKTRMSMRQWQYEIQTSSSVGHGMAPRSTPR